MSQRSGADVRTFMQRFFEWYERHYTINVAVATGLFVLQLAHLYWLTTNVVALRLVGESYFNLSGVFEYTILIVDYTEIPALLSVSLLYAHGLRTGWNWKSFIFLLFLNSQWLHMFWITDEFVVNEFAGRAAQSSLPAWLAWTAILIDYLELPVIYDTLRKFAVSLRERRVGEFLREDVTATD